MNLDWKSISGIIGDIAPVVGTALGGPAGAAIGSIISAALGTDNTPDAIAEAVKNNPDAALKLKELENTHAETIKQLEIQARKNELDAQNANDGNVTQRWLSDNTAGGLPAMTRPLLVWWTVIMFTFISFVDGNFFGIKINPAYIPIYQMLLVTVVGGYMGLRTFEKWTGSQNDDVKVIKK